MRPCGTSHVGGCPRSAFAIGIRFRFGQDQQIDSIARGKLADFFLVPGDLTKDLGELRRIPMVVKDGTVYFPDQIYPHFGIKPLASAPTVAGP